MESIENIKNNNKELYEKLQKYNCKMTYNNKVIYEGIFKEDIDYRKYNQSNIVCEFNINDNKVLLLLKDNENINKLNKLFENKQFDNIYNDAKLFNKAMNLANNLPLYNLDKELFENNIIKDIKKYGINFQKIYENLQISNNQIQEKLKINSKSKVGNDKDEEFYEKTSTNLLVEIQNEIDKDGEYHTYSFEDGKKKFKKGFLTFNEDGEFVSIIAFNTAEDFANMIGDDEDKYKQYENINVGSCIDWGENDGSTSQILRIW